MSDLLTRMPAPYEPKRENRWVLRFPSELGINEWWAVETKRPSIKQNIVPIPFINTKTYVVGQFEWDAMDIKFRDVIGPSTSQAIMEWVRLHSESVTGRQGYASGYQKDLELEMLDPTGVAVEKWKLEQVTVGNVDFGSLNYDSDALVTISMSIQPSRCVLLY